MIFHFDLEKLYRLLQDFYAICHIRTTVFTREVGLSPGPGVWTGRSHVHKQKAASHGLCCHKRQPYFYSLPLAASATSRRIRAAMASVLPSTSLKGLSSTRSKDRTWSICSVI